MIDDKNLKTLEFDKILALLSNEADSKTAKKMCKEIKITHSLDKANSLLKQSSDAYFLIAKYASPVFSSLEDITQLLDRANAGGMLSTKELVQVSRALACFRCLKNWKLQETHKKTSLDVFFDGINANKYLEEKINSCIISEEEIDDRASNELYVIRKAKQAQQDSIKEKLEKISRNPSLSKYLQEAIITIRDGRYVLPVKSEHKGKIKGIVHDSSSSGSTLFIEPISVVKTNNSIRELQIKEKIEIDKILSGLSTAVATFSQDLYKSFKMAVRLDVIFAKAKLAYKMKASLPILNDKGRVNLYKARHPLIDSKKVVAVDINLGINFDVLVITGPNTGGKTVSLKTVGLFSLMAMCGLMIPADDRSELSVFNSILTDIGDEQSIEQSLSTFSSHMQNIVNIIKKANNKSLVLLDELGSGTDPVEGAALAMAIIDKLKSNGSKIIATTHYAELKSFAAEKQNVENACCEFDMKSLQPTYKLLIGIPGSSNAFAISRKLGLEEVIIQNAKTMLSSKNKKFEFVVKNMQKSIKNLQRKQDEYDKLIKENTKIKELLQEEKQNLSDKLSVNIKEEKEKARNIAQRAVEKSEELINELNKLVKKKQILSAQKRAEINKKMRNLQNDFDPITINENRHDFNQEHSFQEGDTVMILDINTKATIVKIESKDTALVKTGSMKSRVKLSNLKAIKKDKNTKSKISVKTYTANQSATSSTELDLRGKTSEEALIEIDKFIDCALLRNINRISVIHGKGSGKLKNSVHLHLSKHKSVESYRLGTFGEGDSGVTIIKLI